MDLSFLISSLSFLLVSIITFFFFFFFLFKQQAPAAKPNSILKPYPIIGNLPHFIKNRNRPLQWASELLSTTTTISVPPVVFTADPANVEHIAKSHFNSYQRSHSSTTTLADFFGHGILNVNGEPWRLQRKTASAMFNTRTLRAFVLDAVRREVDGRLVPLLARASRTGEVVDLQDVLERFAFDNICGPVLGEDPGVLGGGSEEWEKFYHDFEEATRLSLYRWSYLFHWMWKLMRWLNLGSERRLSDALETVHVFIDRLVRSRPRGGETSSYPDLLSRFTTEDDDGASLHSDASLHDILISFLLAGRDTTPSALTWFFWALSSKPAIVSRILGELKINGPVLTLDVLREMNYLHAALSESMRLHPPVPLIPRECVAWDGDVLPDGTVVRKGWTVMYSPYAMGRAERVWGEDCGEFKPERWLDEEGVFRAKSPFWYAVFHAGPRMCLGKEMAYIQMKAVAASILERFEVEVVEGRVEEELMITMRVAGGLPVRVKERKA